LTVFSVFDMLMMMLLYFSLKVAEVSLSKSSHLVPSWLTGYKLCNFIFGSFFKMWGKIHLGYPCL